MSPAGSSRQFAERPQRAACGAVGYGAVQIALPRLVLSQEPRGSGFRLQIPDYYRPIRQRDPQEFADIVCRVSVVFHDRALATYSPQRRWLGLRPAIPAYDVDGKSGRSDKNVLHALAVLATGTLRIWQRP